MSTIKPLPIEDLDTFVTIAANAYPGMAIESPEDRERNRANLEVTYSDPARCLYGLYRGQELLGGMMLWDFTMTMLSMTTLVGGVGYVAVDLLHKKQKVAKELIEFFLHHFRERGATMTALYPFRPDFYKKMGFGYGAKMSHYRVRTSALPAGGPKENVRVLSQADTRDLTCCYNRFAETTHGMIQRTEIQMRSILLDPPGARIVGYENSGNLTGYLGFRFDRGSTFLQNDLQVDELVFEDRDSLAGLLAFLSTQSDQSEWITISTADDSFHHLLADPRNDTGRLIRPIYHESNTQGVGLMYRVIDVVSLFDQLSDHNFGAQTCKVEIVINDSFLPQNANATIVHFDGGRPHLPNSNDHEVTIRLDVSDFSSLLMGVVTFERLFMYGLAELSDLDYLEVVNRLFSVDRKPVCLTRF